MNAQRLKYRRARKWQKSRILDHLQEGHGYNRSYLARCLRHEPHRQGGSESRGRKPIYTAVHAVLKHLWTCMDYICGTRLAPLLPELVDRLMACGELRLDAEQRALVCGMSGRTIDRLLSKDKRGMQVRSKARTRPGTLLRHQIPIKTFAEWHDATPGFVALDCVGHDGGSARGDYNQTLNVTDVATGWTTSRAVKNKAQVWVFAALQDARAAFPFPWLGIHSDNGSEFINDELVRYCTAEHLTFTRSRPGKKNDNCYVEQKNWSVVRRAVGYARHVGDEALLNELYRVLALYHNFFMPVMKCVAKTRHGSRVTRHYDTPQTPYQRVLASPDVAPQVKARLRTQYPTLNPAALKREITRVQGCLARAARRYGASVVLQKVA